MADSKVTALTELTSFSGDETFYVVEDDDGTPVSRRMTVENLAAGLAARSEMASTYAQIWVAKGELTNTTPNSLTYVQWGTNGERPLVDDAETGANTVQVIATLTGRVKVAVAGAAKRALAKVEISLDAGSTWADGWTGTDDPMVAQATGHTTTSRFAISDQAIVSGTPTGDILARALCSDVAVAGDFTFEGGRIIMQVMRANF